MSKDALPLSPVVAVGSVKARMPLGIGHPRDVGDAVVYLASDAARWVTGQTLVLSGGMSVF